MTVYRPSTGRGTSAPPIIRSFLIDEMLTGAPRTPQSRHRVNTRLERRTTKRTDGLPTKKSGACLGTSVTRHSNTSFLVHPENEYRPIYGLDPEPHPSRPNLPAMQLSSASSVRRPSTVMAGRPVVSTMPWRRSVKSRSRSSRLLRARFGLLVLLGMLHMVPRDSNAASRNSGVGRSQTQ